MKRHITDRIYSLIAMLFVCFAAFSAKAQEQEKSPLVVTISYFSCNNSVQYLTVNAKTKVARRFQPVGFTQIALYLNKDSSGKGLGFIGKVVTNEKGLASISIPASLAEVWNASAGHTFIATTEKSKQFDETSTELTVAKAKLTIDTADDKTVTATLTELKAEGWTPVKGVDVKLGIKRMGGDLQVGDEQTYTTDSLGHVSGAFKKPGIPGDKAGGIVLVARVDDNDQYGNLRVERDAPWGARSITGGDFFHRALWASRFHSPVWLVVIAYSIIVAVWGIIIYLVYLLFRIRKLGRTAK